MLNIIHFIQVCLKRFTSYEVPLNLSPKQKWTLKCRQQQLSEALREMGTIREKNAKGHGQ
jgi:hypothetical protein